MGIFKAKEKKDQIKILQELCKEYESVRNDIVDSSIHLFENRQKGVEDLEYVKDFLDSLENAPEWSKEDFDESFESVHDFKTAVKYAQNPEQFAEETDKSGRTGAYWGAAAGVAAGVGGAIMGPTAAMSLATVLGTASTGTAIGALSGAAATNAALAWLGGGAVAAGGTGMAGGSLFLGFLGPIGWSIAAVSALSGLAIFRNRNKKELEIAQKQSEDIQHDLDLLKTKKLNLENLLGRTDDQAKQLKVSIHWAMKVNPRDYEKWGTVDKQRFENLMNNVANTVLLINSRI